MQTSRTPKPSLLNPLRAVVLLVATLVAAPSFAQSAAAAFDVKGLNLGVQQATLEAMSDGPEGFKCQRDVAQYLTTVCSARFEARTCIAPPGTQPGMRMNCSTGFRPIEQLPSALQQIATVGGSRVVSIQASFFDGKATEILFFHKDLTPQEFVTAFVDRYGKPTREVWDAAQDSDNGRFWDRNGDVLKQSKYRVDLMRPAVAEARRQRFAADLAASKARKDEKLQVDRKRAQSDI